jgi:hypothetical protein
MQAAEDRLTQDAPHDMALGRCSFTGSQLTATKTGVSRQQQWFDWELCWAKAEIVAKRSDCDPYSTTEECANASRMPNHGRPWHKCRRSSSIGPWHGMLCPGVLWPQRLSRFHSWTLHWHTSVEQRWGCRNVWPPATGMVAGPALTDPSSRRRLGGWASSAPAKAALLVSHQRCQSRGGIIHAHDRALMFSCAER